MARQPETRINASGYSCMHRYFNNQLQKIQNNICCQPPPTKVSGL